MKTMMYYLYDTNINTTPLYQRLYTGTVEEAIGWCIKIKEEYGITPIGFTVVDYEDNGDTMVDIIDDTRHYYFNGKIIDANEIPRHWTNIKTLKSYGKLIYINENFCFPYDEERDEIININI